MLNIFYNRIMRHLFALLAATTLLGAFAWRPVQAQPYVMGPGLYDDRVDTQGLLVYTGTNGWSEQSWTMPPANCAYQGTTTRYPSPSDGTDGVLSFSIWGDGFVVYAFEINEDVVVDFCVDSICTPVSFFTAGSTACKQVSVTGLGYGTHEVELVYDSAGIPEYFYFDAVQVLPPPPQPTLPPQEIEVQLTFIPIQPTFVFQPQDDYRHLWTIDDQVVAFDYAVTAGDVSLLLFLAVMALLLFIAMLIYLMRRPAS